MILILERHLAVLMNSTYSETPRNVQHALSPHQKRLSYGPNADVNIDVTLERGAFVLKKYRINSKNGGLTMGDTF